MNFVPFRQEIDTRLIAELSGAVAAGVATAAPVNEQARRHYERWIEAGCHGAMDYMTNYRDIRDNPQLLLDGAQSLIVFAFSYYHTDRQPADSGARIAMYAHGSDYHNVLKKRLKPVVSALKDRFGGDYRICIDSAPLMERYWAVEAGIGFIGLNGQLIVPGAGSYCFIATIVSTVAFAPSGRNAGECLKCGRCIANCPGKAISAGGWIDARRCLSYLTIEAGRTAEASEPLPDGVVRGDRLVGCDVCQEVCPHNRDAVPTKIPQFAMREAVRNLTAAQVLRMDETEFDSLFAGSAIRRAKLTRLKLLLTGHP